MHAGLDAFLAENGLSLERAIGRGHSSQVFLVRGRKGRPFVLKIERPDSTRFRMAERESENLGKANSAGIGPRLESVDLGRRAILMEYIEGPPFCEWLFSNPSKAALKRFVEELLRQAALLDSISLDHGQLAGRGKNILARKGRPVIIDFEKASSSRKCHNLSTVKGFLFRNPNSAIAKKVKAILGPDMP